jgi:hypothetical protein
LAIEQGFEIILHVISSRCARRKCNQGDRGQAFGKLAQDSLEFQRHGTSDERVTWNIQMSEVSGSPLTTPVNTMASVSMNEEPQTQPKLRRKVLRLAFFSLFVLLLSFIFWKAFHAEPSYKDKPFSYWVDQLPLTLVLTNQGMGPIRIYSGQFFPTTNKATLEIRDEAFSAVRAIGRQELPLLMRHLGARKGSLQDIFVTWALKRRWLKPGQVQTAVEKRGKALTALLELDWRATPIVPDLIRLCEDPDPDVRLTARYALQKVDPVKSKELQKAWRTNSF